MCVTQTLLQCSRVDHISFLWTFLSHAVNICVFVFDHHSLFRRWLLSTAGGATHWSGSWVKWALTCLTDRRWATKDWRVYTITVVYTFTKLHDSVHVYGGNEQIRCFEMKKQLKDSIAQHKILFATLHKIKQWVDRRTSFAKVLELSLRCRLMIVTYYKKAVLSQRRLRDAPIKVNKQPHLHLRSRDSRLT